MTSNTKASRSSALFEIACKVVPETLATTIGTTWPGQKKRAEVRPFFFAIKQVTNQ
jgi:hypothetical protein